MADCADLSNQKENSESKSKTTGKKRKKEGSNSYGELPDKNERKNTIKRKDVLPNQKEKLTRKSKIKTTGKKRKNDGDHSFRKSAKKNKKLKKNESAENDPKDLKHGKESNSECMCPAWQVSLKNDKHSSKPMKEKSRDNNVMIKKKKRNNYMNTYTEKISIVNDNKDSKIGEKLSYSDYEVSNASDVIILSDDDSGNLMEKEKEKVWDGYSPLHHIRDGKNDKVKKLLEKGYQRKMGKWTQDEIEQLNKNMDDFLENNKVTDFWGLIDARTKEDKQFRKKTDFVLKMCKGILRTGTEVNIKVYQYFGKPYLKTGKIDTNELEQLRKLHSKYGNNWKTIGTFLNRGKTHIGNIFYDHKTWDKSKWSYEEDKTLLSLVVSFKEKNQTMSWKTVSDELKTRSLKHCFNRWSRHYSHIDTKFAFENWLAKREKEDLSIDSYFKENEIYKLITTISDLNVDDEFLINWNELTKYFDNVPSAAWLKLKFQAVCKEVPYSHRLEFTELIEQLLNIYEEKVNKNVGHVVGEINNDIEEIFDEGMKETDDDIEIIDSADDDDDDLQIIE